MAETFCTVTGKPCYHVAWQGYPPSDRSWEFRKALRGSGVLAKWRDDERWQQAFLGGAV